MSEGTDGRDGGNHDEEGMTSFVKNFSDVANLRGFMENQLHLPPSMHDQFSSFRRALGARFKQFGDLKTFKDQLSYFFEVFNEVKVMQASWVIYSTSLAYLYKSTGKFPEMSGALFQSEHQLGHLCSMRAKYVLMGLKDLVQMKQLKCDQETQQAIVNLATTVDIAMPLPTSHDFDAEDKQLIGALSGFDGESCFT